jgi:hypothetical protein
VKQAASHVNWRLVTTRSPISETRSGLERDKAGKELITGAAVSTKVKDNLVEAIFRAVNLFSLNFRSRISGNFPDKRNNF